MEGRAPRKEARAPRNADGGRGFAACHAEVPGPAGACSPAALAAALGAPSFLWSAPDREVFALGEVARTRGRDGPALVQACDAPGRIRWEGSAPPHLPGPWVAALAFEAAAPACWPGFAAAEVFLPALLCWREAGRWHAAAFAPAQFASAQFASAQSVARERLEAALVRLERARAASGPREDAPRAHRIEEPSARAAWDRLIGEALSAIGRGELGKVVCARAIEVELSGRPDPVALAASLARRFPSCSTFLLRGQRGAGETEEPVFLGATPESFARLEGRSLRLDALAGTAPPGAPLLGSDKDLREHRAVVEFLRARLAPLCTQLTASEHPSLLRLSNLDHLHTPVRALLRAEVGLAQVIAALHPTPAVAGTPQEAALRFLAQHEQLQRGLYAGLIGLLGEGRAELAVALRSALLRGRHARLFVGAGVVLGSTPAGEWAETELKAHALLDALGATPAEQPRGRTAEGAAR